MPYRQAKGRVVDQFTRNYVENLLARTAGNVSRAARLSGIGRASLQKIMRRLKIDADRFRPDGQSPYR